MAELYSKIVPSSCKLIVRKDRVTLKLAKLHQESWLQLQPENKPIRPSSKSDDPSAGLMDLMRDMYQSGDDNMKKVIAEAFVGEMGDDEGVDKGEIGNVSGGYGERNVVF